jgi:carbonic anhydrase
VPRSAAALAALLVLVLASCGGDGETAPPSWSHDPDDASLGPTAWGEIDESFEQCVTGTGQSPVDIAGSVTADLPPLEFGYTATALVVENTGHVVEVPMPEDSNHTLTIEDDEYRLVQYHFHAPSEHTLEGEPYEAEAHLVHENDEGELAVVGVFLDEAGAPNELVDSVLANAPEEAGEEVELEEERSPLELVPVEGSAVEVDRYYTYPGSLTTPVCSEGVRWIVLKDAVGVSPAAAARLHELIAGFPGYDGYENNNRPAQPVNDREIESSES